LNCDENVSSVLSMLRGALAEDSGVLKFNISHGHTWEGVKRGFVRLNYSPQSRIAVKFRDDAGISEGAVDEGGPRREFLQLLMSHLAEDVNVSEISYSLY